MQGFDTKRDEVHLSITRRKQIGDFSQGTVPFLRGFETSHGLPMCRKQFSKEKRPDILEVACRCVEQKIGTTCSMPTMETGLCKAQQLGEEAQEEILETMARTRAKTEHI